MPAGAGNTVQEYLLDFAPQKEAMVMLFSGGLDSFAGAVKQLDDTEHFHVLVSGSTHSRMNTGQAAQAGLLLEGRAGSGHRVAVPYGLPHKTSVDSVPVKLESSQRARGIVHVTLGAIAALQLGASDLFIYENGIGALNLPFDETQSGWQVSRAVHPRTIRLLERLVGEISGQSFRVRMPFLFQTKAESLSGPEIRRFAHGIQATFSCDRFPDRFERKRQCGTCSSCVLRRLALESAGLTPYDPADEYAFHLEDGDAIPKRSAAFVLDKFDAQAERFNQALQHENPWRELTRCCPELREAEAALVESGIPVMTVHEKLMRLLKQHSSEWMKFSGRNALDRFLKAA
jgi:7-cyano-7-deazaguanine synthase in queuosine biosynthesis